MSTASSPLAEVASPFALQDHLTETRFRLVNHPCVEALQAGGQGPVAIAPLPSPRLGLARLSGCWGVGGMPYRGPPSRVTPAEER